MEIRTTEEYWEYIVTIKHQVMKDKIEIVKETLKEPEEIRKSRIDENVYLYYKRYDKLYCVVVKQENKDEGFLITTYPTDKVKEGECIWTK